METQRLNLLDGLRGLAAIAVVLSHYKFFFTLTPDQHFVEPAKFALGFVYDHGFRAVELFWLLSGFVFTHVYCFGREATTREFVISRFARLYPLHLLTLVVVALLQVAAFHSFGQSVIFVQNDAYHFVLNLLFVSAWGFQHGSSFNDVIWSVSVEAAIYALFWLLHRKLARWGPVGAIVIVLACGVVVLTGPPNFIAACGFYFFAGSALALLRRRLVGRHHVGALLLGLAAAGALGLASHHAIYSPAVGLTCSYAAVVLLLVEIDGRQSEQMDRAARWFGDASYGVYLWHFPVMLAFMLIFALLGNVPSLAAQGWFLALYVGSVIGLARLSFVRFERPARLLLRDLGSGPWRRSMRTIDVEAVQ